MEDKVLKVDRARIYLPSESGFKKGDRIYKKISSLGNVVFIAPEEEYILDRDNYTEKVMKAHRDMKITLLEREDLIRLYYSLTFGSEELDNQRRVWLDKYIVNKLEIGSNLISILHDNHLVLCKDYKDLNIYLENKERLGLKSKFL